MKTVQISLNSIDKVKSFVNAITQFEFDFDLISGRYVIDAKSIMGIFSLDLSKPIDLAIHAENNLDEIIRTGTPLSADVIPEMLGTIFYEGTPLHDGAVVIRDGRIVAAGCVLPLSNNLEMGKDMGTRHRAGLGMSENSDAIVVVVSEETGIISLAKNGVLIRRLDRQNLFNLLKEEIIPPETAEAQKQPLLNRLLNKGGAGKHAKTNAAR